MHDPLDPLIDSQLRDVSLPDGMAERLRGIAEPTDENLDRWLREVHCPQTILTRCRAIAADTLLEERLRDCEVPAGLTSRLRAIPLARRRLALRPLAHAAMLFLMISGSYVAFLGWFLGSLPTVVRGGRSEIQLQLAYLDRDRADAIWTTWVTDNGDALGSEGLVTTEELTSLVAQVGDDPLLRSWEPRGVDNPATPSAVSDVRLADEMAKRRRGMNEMSGVPSSRDLLAHVYMYSRPRPARSTQVASRIPLIATGQESLFQPLSASDLRTFRSNMNRRADNLQARPEMAAVEVPVTTDMTSFDIFEELVNEGRWPEGLDIRTEEFLAAMRYDFPSEPRGNIALIPAASPAPLGQRGSILVQVGLKAGGTKVSVVKSGAYEPSPGESLAQEKNVPVLGQGEVVTSLATVTVRFNAQNVKSYRLLGHEPRAVGSDVPMVVQSRPIHAGEEAVLLFEVWLRPGKSMVIADVAVNWYDQNAARSRQVLGQVQKSHIATSFAAAAPSLQVAAVAAESAESLRSLHQSEGHVGSIRAVREALRSSNNRLMTTPEVQRLARLLDAAARIRPELLGK